MNSTLDPGAENKPNPRYKGRPRPPSALGTPDPTRAKKRGTVHRHPSQKLSTREALAARLAFQGFAAKEIAAEMNITPVRAGQLVCAPAVVEEIHRLQTLADTEIIKTVRDRAVKIQEKLYNEFDATFQKIVELRDNGGPKDGTQMTAAKLLFDRAFDTNVIPATTRAKLATEAMNAKNQPPTLNIYVTSQEALGLTQAIDETLELDPSDYSNELDADAETTDPDGPTDDAAPPDETPTD